MVAFNVHEQDLMWYPGKRQYRVMQSDNGLIAGRTVMGRLTVDFETRDDAIECIKGEMRRRRLPCRISFYPVDEHQPAESFEYIPDTVTA
jgi:hypothetical protein